MRAIAASLTLVALASAARSASAGIITKAGNVVALTDIAQMKSITGTAGFDEGPIQGPIPLNQYSSTGLTWRVGPLTQILPGCTTGGSATNPEYWSNLPYFPNPGGGGTHVGQFSFYAGVATFNKPITQVGLTASTNGNQYLTVWNAAGTMLGQVNWEPGGTSSFVGIDSMGVPIAMVAYGNHDLWNGMPYDIGGDTIINDTWVWGPGDCTIDADCNDSNPCTDDSCNAPVCVHAPNTAACNDGSACTMPDVCSAGTCGGIAIDCDDGLVCTFDTCDVALGCLHKQDTCDDGNPCTDDTCDPVTGCNHASNTAACDDKDACTGGDVCSAGSCVGTLLDCDDDNACTDDSCTAATGCQHLSNAGPCDDGDACTTGEACAAGICAGGTAVSCEDNNECTIDDCTPEVGCVHPSASGPCNVTACASGYCSSGTCSVPTTNECDDDDACTEDSCVEPDGCAHATIEHCCNTDAECDGNQVCGKNHRCGANNTDENPGNPVDSAPGCSCTAPGSTSGDHGWLALLGLVALSRRRGRTVKTRRDRA